MPSRLPIIIRRKLDRFNRSLRFYAALDGIAVLLFALVPLFLLDIVLDRFFEFSLLLRTVLLPILTAIITYIFSEQILFRYFASIRRDQLATALEFYVPHLNESLITAIEGEGNDEVNPELMQHTIDEAVAALRGVNVHHFFRTRNLLARFTFSLLCVAAVTAGCLYHSETVFLWFSRNVLLSLQEYPRRSELLVDGFQDGRVRIGRGDSFTLSIRANAEKPKIPEAIRVQIGSPEVGYRTLLIDQFRIETLEGIRWRVFTTTFPEMLKTVNLQIRGADSTLNDLCIEVVPTPALTDIVLTQKFPDYMQRLERTIALTGRTMIPDGTFITITATSTKPLLKATAIEVTGSKQRTLADLTDTSGSFDSITLSPPALREDMAIDFCLTDIDSLTNRHPIRMEFGIIRDQPPVVTARLDGIGPAITPEAVLPMVGEIIDDNGLATVVSRYATEPAFREETPREQVGGTVPITGFTSGQTLFPLTQSFAVSSLLLLPEDKLTLHVEASDLFNLDADEGQTGIGPRWSLEIVTPERLKHLLETREITLRQRFEVVISDVERTKTILQDFSFAPMEQQIQEAVALTLESIENESETNREVRQAELTLRKQMILDMIRLEQSDLGKYHITRMLRDTNKEVYDLRNIVEGFRTIRAEMINNRIFTEDERKRIDQEIMQSIQELINVDFPNVDELLAVLNQLLSGRDAPRRSAALEERLKILTQFDVIISKMMAIQEKMASMESFNEMVELLRSIIKQQQQLRNETIEERNRRLRSLME